MLQDFLQTTFLENTIENFCWFAGIILAGLLLKKYLSRILSRFVFRFFKKYSHGIAFENLWTLLRKPVEVFILLVSVYFAFDRLEFPSGWNLAPRHFWGLRMFLFRSFQVSVILSITWILFRMIDFFGLILLHRSSYKESRTNHQLIPFINFIKIIAAVFSLFFILGTVFKLDIASLIAGLGIGGLAIALAAKESLENLIGSFTIFMDKPFVIGDQIKIGNIEGQVERIGFRSTRIRTDDKTYVTVPNKKIVDTELDNLSLRTERRAKFFLHLNSNTSPEQLKAIVADIQTYLDQHPEINKEESRVRFYEFGQNSLKLLVLYYLNTANYDSYINVRQEINFRIIEAVKNQGANFAVIPTSLAIQKQ